MDDAAVADAATEAAESVVFSRYDRGEIEDLDVTIRFEDEQLDVDVYINAPDVDGTQRVAEDAALAALSAVDELLE